MIGWGVQTRTYSWATMIPVGGSRPREMGLCRSTTKHMVWPLRNSCVTLQASCIMIHGGGSPIV